MILVLSNGAAMLDGPEHGNHRQATFRTKWGHAFGWSVIATRLRATATGRSAPIAAESFRVTDKVWLRLGHDTGRHGVYRDSCVLNDGRKTSKMPLDGSGAIESSEATAVTDLGDCDVLQESR